MAEVKQDQKLITFLTSRQKKLVNDKSSFNDRLQDVADLVCPQREDIRGNLVKGESKGTKIYDGTAVSAAVMATNGIHGYHVSPAFPWFRYTTNRQHANKIKEVKEWLGEIENNMYMALNRSNFYAEMWPYIYDGFTIGTSSIYAEEDIAEDRIVLETIHPGEIFIAENKYGDVDVHHRKRNVSARKLVQMFGKEALPSKIQALVDTQPFTEFELIHAVFPREEFDDRMKNVKNKRFASIWYLSDGNHIVRESGFGEFPFSAWRYMKTGKEVYGVSPAHLAMADIKGINLITKTIYGAAQLSIDPAYNVPSYLMDSVDLRPRGLNPIRGNDVISPVNTGANYPIGVDTKKDLQVQIKERFHVDTFLLLTQSVGQGQRTAYEVSEMMAEKAAVLGAELGPFNIQIGNVLERIYEIEDNAGRMPDPPDILLEMLDEDPHLRFDPVYQGPLAQAQKEKFSKAPIRRFFQDLVPLVELDREHGKGEVLDNFNIDAAARIMGDESNLPAEITNSVVEVKKTRDGRALAQQQLEQEEQVKEQLDGAKTLSEVDKNLNNKLSNQLGDQIAQA
jgi:hypothetical protein